MLPLLLLTPPLQPLQPDDDALSRKNCMMQ